MKEGDVVLCPVFSIAHVPKPIQGKGLLFELVEKNGQQFFKYVISKDDLRHSYEQTFLKFKFMCAGLSIASIGHFWVDDVLLNEELKPLWVRRKALKLVLHKEIEPSGPKPLTANNFINAEDITAWVANNYSRVFIYYNTGLFLLRSALPAEYLYGDAMLNFFKIIELVTYKRTKKKPELDVIIADSKSLNIKSVDEKEMQQFYIVRCRDSAHDYDQVRIISRQQAVECKMWVDELIIRDMIARAGKPTNIMEVRDSPAGTIVKAIS